MLEIPLDHIEQDLILTINPVKGLYTCEFKNDAVENGESPYQIKEGQFYQYIFSKNTYGFQASTVVEPFLGKKYLGRLTPNSYVGTLILEIFDFDKNEVAGTVEIEVQSIKAKYREDYRLMLEEITSCCTDLILQLNSPVNLNLSIDFGKDSETDYQRFAFLASILNSESFQHSMQRIISSPTTRWSTELDQLDVRKVRRVNQKIARQFVTGSNRFPLHQDHYLKHYNLHSLPVKINSTVKIDTPDTSENRFVKYVLEAYLFFVMKFEDTVSANTREHKETKILVNQLEELLGHSLFKTVSRPDTLRLNSPVLQRKAGYRELLRSWIQFDLAARLVWAGGEDVYKAGKRDVATLYEYWLFFKLLSLISEIFKIEPRDLDELIKPTPDKLGLQLKQGKHTALSGLYDSGSRKLQVNFSYNRTFSGKNSYPHAGSWTKSMCPDFTLSIWPEGVSEVKAEDQNLIVHIHFDAKYRIENLGQIIGFNDDLSDEKREQAQGKYKNADLLKMHAYRDAIRRTSGAYILYPGFQQYKGRGFHEILPGLGAFPVRPSQTSSGISELKNFVLEVIDHFVNRATQRERLALKTYDIHKDLPPGEVRDILPEAHGPNRSLLPDETNVLVGYFKNKDHWNWIVKNGLYNVRINSDRGSIALTKDLLSATFLLLHTSRDKFSNRLLRINSNEARIFNKQKMQRLGYPNPTRDYLVFTTEKVNIEEFGNVSWDFRKLQEYQSKRKSGFPFVVSLREFMAIKVER